MPTLRAAAMHMQDYKPDYETGKLKKGVFEKTTDVKRRERKSKAANDPNLRAKVITDKAGRTRTVYVRRHAKVKAPKRPKKTTM